VVNNIKNIIRGVVVEWTEDHYRARAQIKEEEIIATINNKRMNPLVKIGNIGAILLNSSILVKVLQYNSSAFFSSVVQNDITNDKILENNDLLDMLTVLESRIFSSIDNDNSSYINKINKLLLSIHPSYLEKSKANGSMAMLYIISIHKDLIFNTLQDIAKNVYIDIEKLTRKV